MQNGETQDEFETGFPADSISRTLPSKIVCGHLPGDGIIESGTQRKPAADRIFMLRHGR